jgi:hypothetical protein
MTLLAWIPFVDPLNGLQSTWYVLLIPLAFGIAMSYKAMRVASLQNYWRTPDPVRAAAAATAVITPPHP